MIITHAELSAAELAWKSQRDPVLFDDAAAALDNAICQADVRRSLRHDPAFVVTEHSNHSSSASRQVVADIHANQAFMLRYTLTEHPTRADVAIHP